MSSICHIFLSDFMSLVSAGHTSARAVQVTSAHDQTASKPKPTPKTGGASRKPSSPSSYDCANDHSVVAKDDNTLQGTLHIGNCGVSKFGSQARRTAVGSALSNSLKKQLAKAGLSSRDVSISSVVGDAGKTVLTYQCPCAKGDHAKVTQALHDACKDQDVKGSIDKDDSSEGVDEHTGGNVHDAPQTSGKPQASHSPAGGKPEASHAPAPSKPEASHAPAGGKPEATHAPVTGKPASHPAEHVTSRDTGMFRFNCFLFVESI